MRIAPGNGGTPAVADAVADLDVADPAAVARHAARERYDLVVIGPEAPLAAGVADASRERPDSGLRSEPWGGAAGIVKGLRQGADRRAGVSTPAAPRSATWLRRSPTARPGRPPVVKADWLAAGKGVVVPETLEEAEAAIRLLLDGADRGATLSWRSG